MLLLGVLAGGSVAATAAWVIFRRARSRLAARLSSLSHDLRTPLASITAYSEILRDDDDPGARARFAGIIHQEAERMLHMIQERLAGHHPERGENQERARDAGGDEARGGAPALTVLVVDDDRFIREATRAMLAREGYEALGAEGGEEALLRARRHRPDLILMDLSMPVMGGGEALRRLRSDPATSDIPVIITTGAAGEPAPEGAAAMLVKPIAREALLAAVGRALEGAAARRT